MSHRTVARACATVVGTGVMSSLVSGAILSDSQLYFDPPSLPSALRPYRDLSSGGSTQFFSVPGRTIVGANILPALQDNDYGDGFPFSQADYRNQPNVAGGYFADLTNGTLTASFDADGVYHVRVRFDDGSTYTESVYVDAGIGDAQGGVIAPRPDQPWREVPMKMGDLYIVSTAFAGDGFIDSAMQALNGKPVVRASNYWEVYNRIHARSIELGRPIDVVVVGHGLEGEMRIGRDANQDNRITPTGAAGTVSAATFGEGMRFWGARSANLFGCSIAGGASGAEFMRNINVPGINVTANTSQVAFTNTSWFTDYRGRKVPAPDAWSVLMLSGAVAAKRRRAA